MTIKAHEELLVLTMAGSFWPVVALAEETVQPAGYSDSDYVWVFVIATVLVYGVYDTFLKTP